jgi:hypothetical protein
MEQDVKEVIIKEFNFFYHAKILFAKGWEMKFLEKF